MATNSQPNECTSEGEISKNLKTPELGMFNITKVIGHCYDAGVVLLATAKSSNDSEEKLYALRKYSLEKCQKDIGLFLKEVWLMKHLKHNNLLTCINSFVTGQSICLVTPLMDYGSASDLIQTHFPNGFPEVVIAGILRDVLHALIYLHSKGYIHRSVRASHVLISSLGQVVLTGLRDAYCIVEKGKWQTAVFDYPSDAQRCFCWISPELLQQNLRGYSEKSDIYSLGITACELANGIAPFVDLVSTELLIKKLNGPPPQLWDSSTVPTSDHRIAFSNQPSDSGVFDGVNASSNIDTRLEAASQRTFSTSFHRFTMLCVQAEPTLRPTATQLMKHPFIQSIRKGSNIGWMEYLTCVPTISNIAARDVPTCMNFLDYCQDERSCSPVDGTVWDFRE